MCYLESSVVDFVSFVHHKKSLNQYSVTNTALHDANGQVQL